MKTAFLSGYAGLVLAIASPLAGAEDAGKRQKEVAEVTGKVVGTKKVDVRGTPFAHFLVTLQAKTVPAGYEGREVVVDLGPTDNLREWRIIRGAEITVHGGFLELGDRKVFMADRLTAEGRTTKIERQVRLKGRRGPTQPATEGRRARVTGKVVAAKKVKVRGRKEDSRTEILVALVNTKSGDRLIVDLGPADRLGIGVTEGKTVSAAGRLRWLNDKRVLMARSVTIEGTETDIQRTHPATTDRAKIDSGGRD